MSRRDLLALSFTWMVVGACRPSASTTSPGDAAASPEAKDTLQAWPDEAFRASRPEPGREPSLTLPNIHQFTLANGILVYLVERHELPTVQLNLSFDLGSGSDPRGKEGLAALAAQLLGEGTRTLDKVAFEARQADLASSIMALASAESTLLMVRTLKRNLEPTIDLMAELLAAPGLRAADFDRIRSQRRASLAQAKASPTSVAGRVWNAIVRGATHPHGRVVTDRSLESLSLADCKRHVTKLGPKGARLFVAGDVTEAELRALLDPKLVNWKGVAPSGPRAAAARPPSGTVFFVDIPGAAQSQIYVGHTGPRRQADDYEATMLMAQILGGSFSSRINMNIREKHGYAYGARAGFSYFRHGSSFGASSSVRTDATGPALREIAKELAGMRGEDPTPVELAREQAGARLSLPSQFATSSDILSSFSTLVFFALPLDWWSGYKDRVAAVDAAKVRFAAETHLHDGGYKVLVAGDAKVILPDLEQIAAEKIFGPGALVHIDADGKPLPRPRPAAARPSASASAPAEPVAAATDGQKPVKPGPATAGLKGAPEATKPSPVVPATGAPAEPAGQRGG